MDISIAEIEAALGGEVGALGSFRRAREQLEQVYQQMAESFGDVKINDEKMGEIATQALFRIRYLSIGRVAPEIESEDVSGTTFKLSDYRGKVVVLSFWGHW